MTIEPDIPWRVGFEVEVVLGELGDPRFDCELDGPMDVASLAYCKAVAQHLAEATGYSWKARNPETRWSRPGFYVVPEYDLDPLHWPYGRYAGVELLTPPLKAFKREVDSLLRCLRQRNLGPSDHRRRVDEALSRIGAVTGSAR